MQAVSQGWIDAQNQTIVPESFLEIEFGISDPAMLAKGSATATQEHTLSNVSLTIREKERNKTPYITMEKNATILDGTYIPVPQSSNRNSGYIGTSISSSTGLFAYVPTITIKYSDLQTKELSGLTIEWGVGYEEFPRSFIIDLYNDNIRVGGISVTDNTDIITTNILNVANYNRIEIKTPTWCLPNRRARVSKIYVGILKVFDKNDIMYFQQTMHADHLAQKLPSSEITYDINNIENEYDLLRKDGIYKHLMEQQKMFVRYGYDIDGVREMIKGGTFFLSQWKAPQNGIVATFVGNDLFSMLDKPYIGGVYSERGTPCYDIIENILYRANLPKHEDGSDRWVIDNSLKYHYTNAPVDILPARECLQLLCNLAGATMYQDRNGVLIFEPVSTRPTRHVLMELNNYTHPEVFLTKPVSRIEVKVYQYLKPEKEEKEFVCDETFSTRTRVKKEIRFSKAIRVPSLEIENGIVHSRIIGSRGCIVDVTPINAEKPITVKVEGFALELFSSYEYIDIAETGEVVTIDNPLCTTKVAAQHIIASFKKDVLERRQIDFNIRSSPVIDPNDIVLEEKSGLNMMISSLMYTYDGMFVSKGSGAIYE